MCIQGLAFISCLRLGVFCLPLFGLPFLFIRRVFVMFLGVFVARIIFFPGPFPPPCVLFPFDFFAFVVFRFFLFQSISTETACLRTLCLLYPVRWHGIALSTSFKVYCFTLPYNSISDVVALFHRACYQHEDGVCWMSTGRKNGLLCGTYTQ